MQSVAILDFGTNTFNLLIAKKKGDSFHIIYTGKQPAKIGKGGINNQFITSDAMDRGLDAISHHMKTIREYDVQEIHAFATSAFRNATNGQEYASIIKERFGFTTKIINGDEEAALIYEGIKASMEFTHNNAMILDIGGGSNEFIICNENGIRWKKSFDLGMARIIEKFHLSDPIKKEEIKELEAYYSDNLSELTSNIQTFKPEVLIGASGSFDTIRSMAKERFMNYPEKLPSTEIWMEHYQKIHQLLLNSTTEERLKMPGMEPVRVEMIVPATIFINFVLQHYNIKSFRQSDFALKEGALSRMINK